jgi:hypothetical protein
MDNLLDARTPAEAKRHWMIDRLWWITWFCFVALSFLIGIVWLGAWPESLAGQRISILGWSIAGVMVMLASIIWTFAIGGPVGRWEARWRDASLGAYGDDDRVRDAYDGATPK